MMIKCGVPCCTYGLLMPKLCIAAEGKMCCVKTAGAFPFAGPVPGPVCAVCGFSCMPEMGFMKPPPAAKGAPTKAEEMER